MRRIERENAGIMKPGQDIVIAGYAGLWGTVEIVKHKKGDLCHWFSEEYMNRILENEGMALEGNLKQWEKAGASECEAAGEGGVLKALWDLSGAYMTGICFTLRKIPVKQETIEICERYDLNPYRLFSTGCLVLLADNGGDLVLALEKEGIPGAVIGKVTDGIKRIITHEESTGYLERPSRDEIYKVLAE